MMTVDTPTARAGVAEVPPAGVPARAGVWGVVRALAWKESREIGILTGVLGVAYGALLAMQLRDTQSITERVDSYDAWHEMSALSDEFMHSTLVAGPIAALLIGFIQFLRESRPDRYGLLTHRAASRSTIFWSKAGVGIGMYVAALGLPLLVALWWASDPGNIPLPFSWRMGLAPMADILSGVPYYFAGVLVAQRTDARWEVSRLLPIAGPVIGSLLDWFSPHFGWAVLAIGMVSVVMGIAARGYFVAAGQYVPIGRVAKPVMGLVLFVAIVTVGMAGYGFLYSMTPHNSQERIYQSLTYYKDGTPVLRQWWSREKTIVTDIQGRILEETSDDKMYTGESRFMIASYGWMEYDDRRDNRMFHSPPSYFKHKPTLSGQVDWYQSMSMTGGDYLVGFDSKERKLVGAIGANGFEAGVSVPSARFARPMRMLETRFLGVAAGSTFPVDQGFISAGDTLYRLGKGYAAEPVVKTMGNEPILGLQPIVASLDNRGKIEVTSDLMLQTKKEVLIVRGEGPRGVVYRYAFPDGADYVAQVIKVAATGEYIVEITSHSGGYVRESCHLVYLKPDWTVDHVVDASWKQIVGGLPKKVDILEDIVGPSLLPPAAVVLPLIALRSGEAFSMMMEGGVIHALAISWCVGSLVAVGIFFMARRKAMGNAAWMWGIMGLLLGPAGLVLMLCLRGLPVVVKCAGCGKGRRVDQGKCPHCGAGISGPAANGTEIFG